MLIIKYIFKKEIALAIPSLVPASLQTILCKSRQRDL
jgi:hypothetical protein